MSYAIYLHDGSSGRDGRAEFLTPNHSYPYSTPDGTVVDGFSDLLVIDGDSLADPVYSGIIAGAVSRSIIWGSVGDNAFITRDGITTFLNRLDGFEDGEVIIDLYETNDRIIVLGRELVLGRVAVFDRDHDRVGVLGDGARSRHRR